MTMSMKATGRSSGIEAILPVDINKIVAKTYLGAMAGRGDVDLFETTLADDYEVILTGQSKISGTLSREQHLAFVRAIPKMFVTGLNFEILSMTAEGDRVACESRVTCTLVNGLEYNNEYLHLFRFRDGKICRTNEFMDTQLAETALLPIIVLE
ncbi:nuclear transport factor 2 family protein [Rhodococcus sp. WS1]|uniref:nuclear transport factor 2 family protein n=1 Tax=unclassified Rhodococcus (in: high G+C Gram-positive bacteria) TaxID=192944 RepID=UPI0011421E9C|nr:MULTISPECIES: nuclear transport factor 2 family protein [unclassified Rhodococcus (in: high G+C Gram-positive bacteria)]ROZ52918.1 nuclear transport factor 2 family protein [Rhodococcus sp. WS1]TQC36010.1 nuclear transport factor 2 family protein [Rhodococcus sp. WS7]